MALGLVVGLVLVLAGGACSRGAGESAGAPRRPPPADRQPTERKEGGTPATGEGLPADTLVDYATLAAGNPKHIDPALADTRSGAQIADLLYDGLTRVDSHNDLLAEVADSWVSNHDATQWTFTLREGVTFSDGEEVTPTTFKRSWERALHPELESSLGYHFVPIEGAVAYARGDAEEIVGVEADDGARTLTVTLVEPLSEWPAIVSHTVFSPVPAAAHGATSGDEIREWERTVMLGNGPYVLTAAWQRGQPLVLEANDAYGGPAPRLPRIEFHASDDVEAAYEAFVGGRADTAAIPAGRFEEAIATYNHVTDPSFGLYHLAVSWDDDQIGGPENLAVRQAISLAIDRERINTEVYGGTREVATGVTPPGIPGYVPDLCGYLCTHDPARAGALVEEWGRAASMDPIRLQYNRGGDHEDVIAIVRENLEAVGLRVEEDPRDGETYFAEMKAPGGCQLCRSGWIWDYPSYHSGLYPLFTSAGIDGDNLGRFVDPAVDETVAAAARHADGEGRARLWNEAEQMILGQMAVIPLTWYANQIVHTDRVRGLVANGLEVVNYPDIRLDG